MSVTVERVHTHTRDLINNKGITLLALIITIVILLILAVVTIKAIKESSIITHSQGAKDKYTIAQEKEQIQLALSEWQIQKNIPTNTQTFKGTMKLALEKEATIGDDDDENGPITVTFIKTGNAYKVLENGTITEIVEDLAYLKSTILAENLSGRNLAEIADITRDENDDLQFVFNDSNIKYKYRTYDTSGDNDFSMYIEFNENWYRFRYVNQWIDDNNMAYITDPEFGVKLVEKIDETSRVGKKVKFNESIWTILYDDSAKGLQIISDKCLGSLFTLGEDDNLKVTKNDYNNAVTLLNTACENLFKINGNYINNYIKDVRCVGSNPEDKTIENTTPFKFDEVENCVINGLELYGTDDNYASDYDRMVMLGIQGYENDIEDDENDYYFLASRFIEKEIDGYNEDNEFEYMLFHSIRTVGRSDEGNLDCEGMFEEQDEDTIDDLEIYEANAYLRPVITLINGVEFSGEGTTENPYIIKSGE